MLKPTCKLRWVQVRRGVKNISEFAVTKYWNDSMYAQVLQQKWEHENNVDEDGKVDFGKWLDVDYGTVYLE